DNFQGSEKLDYNQYWATIAAAGVYNVSFTTTGNTAATMYNFSGMGFVYTVDQYNAATGAETPTNEIGVPYNKLNTKSGNKGTIQLELTASGNISRSTQFFGICAESDCSVTINLERTGDAEEPPEIETTYVEAPQNLEKYTAQSGTLTLMTIDGSLAYVLGDDGYYHVGSKTGPVLLVNLTKTLSRVGECSIIDLGTSGGGNPYWATGYIFPIYEGNTLTARYDYSEFLKAYADKVNSDGVYPVDEAVFTFLQRLAAKGQMKETQSAGEYALLLPCQYYMPADGMDATGAGSQTDPFILIGTTNKIDLSGISDNAYAQFTATTAGIYTFAVSGCTIAVDGNKSGFNIDNALHICLAENERVTFTVEGTGNASITVGNATAALIEPFFGDDSGEDGVEPSKGLTESNAIQLTSNGYSAFVVDKEINPDGVWVYVQPLVLGSIDYSFAIKSPLAQIVYNGKVYQYGDTLELTCTSGTKYAFLLTAKDGSNNVVNGIYALEWTVVEKQISGSGEMKLGNNSVTLSASESNDGVEYTFTSEEGGQFIITTDSEDAFIFDGDSIDYVYGTDSYQFTLEAGETFTFYCAGPYNTAVSYNVIIEPYTATGDAAFDDNGGTKHIVVHESDFDGIEFMFVSTNGGTYTISVANNANAIIMTDAESNGKGGMATVINTAAGTCSYEFTLEAGGYIT
ncbi:MAG: hypothetical protein K2N52_01525, partial [Clostridia bacterium]|nr:hypothetical protein [Clostridia bacterium]